MSAALRLLEQMISRPSVTPDDAGCQALIGERLQPLGFELHWLPAGPEDFRVTNLWARRQGSRPGLHFAFAGHTDVVPPGPLEHWSSDPFVPTHRDGQLHGRGAADMKTSLACMVVATEEFIQAQPDHAGSLSFLLTSDEEGPSVDGTLRLVELLQQRAQALDACVVGEPTSVNRLGDTIKNGRRGSLSARLKVLGVQGHVAYPQLARNPIHAFAPALAELAATVWDEGNAYFPPTTWQVSNIHGGTGATNVIPGELTVDFNFRFSSHSAPESLRERVAAILQRHGVEHEIAWTLGGPAFLTPPGSLSRALGEAIAEHTGVQAELSTTGGTSDGRFIARICPQVVEFGPINATIHKVNERVALHDIEALKNIYRGTLQRMLGA